MVAKRTPLPLRLYPLYLLVLPLTALVRVSVLLWPGRLLPRLLNRQQPEGAISLSPAQQQKAQEVGRAVSRVAKYVPWRCKCLEQGLTAQAILWMKGIKSTLVIGVMKEDNGKLLSHAWLKCGSETVVGGRGSEDFRVIAEWKP